MQPRFTAPPVLPDMGQNLEDQPWVNVHQSFSLNITAHAAARDWIVKSGYGRIEACHKPALCDSCPRCSQP